LILQLPVGLPFAEQRLFEDYDLALHLHHLLAVAARPSTLVFAPLHRLFFV
jgi:hypothetical protein